MTSTEHSTTSGLNEEESNKTDHNGSLGRIFHSIVDGAEESQLLGETVI